MADEVTHEDNATPDATDDDVKRVDEDGPLLGDDRPGASANEGAGAGPVDSNPETVDDPKGSQRPV